jgi:hypothetical protein
VTVRSAERSAEANAVTASRFNRTTPPETAQGKPSGWTAERSEIFPFSINRSGLRLRATFTVPVAAGRYYGGFQPGFNLPPKRPLLNAPSQIVHHHIRRGMSMQNGKYRLVTRSDFDGLVCAVLLREIDLIDDIKFVHPKDMQDGTIEITARDITTNLPYVAGAHLVFDHHESETVRNVNRASNHVIDAHAPSAARVVYDYYGGKCAVLADQRRDDGGGGQSRRGSIQP